MITNIDKFINEELGLRGAMKPKNLETLLNIKKIDSSHLDVMFEIGIDPCDPKYFRMDLIKQDANKKFTLSEIEEQFGDGYGAEVYHFFKDYDVDLFNTKYWNMELLINDLTDATSGNFDGVVFEGIRDKMKPKKINRSTILNLRDMGIDTLFKLKDMGIDIHNPKFINIEKVVKDATLLYSLNNKDNMSVSEMVEKELEDGYNADVHDELYSFGVELFDIEYWNLGLIADAFDKLHLDWLDNYRKNSKEELDESVKSKMVGKSIDEFKEIIDGIIKKIANNIFEWGYFDNHEEAWEYIESRYSKRILEMLDDSYDVDEIVEDISTEIEENMIEENYVIKDVKKI